MGFKDYLDILEKHKAVEMRTLSLAGYELLVPVVRLHGKKAGPTIVITAGIDGDEYAGIQAAIELIDELNDTLLCGTVVLLPVVNVRGYLAGTSWNPIDGKYLKHWLPGTASASISFALMATIAKEYLSDIAFWIDLHAGATQETLNVFAWSYKTGVANIDLGVRKILESLQCSTIVFQKVRGEKSSYFSQVGTGYLISEAGERGLVKPVWVTHHKTVVFAVLNHFTMVKSLPKKPVAQTWYSHVEYVTAVSDGTLVSDGDKISLLLHGVTKQIVALSGLGHTLWRRLPGPCQRGDILVAWAS